MLLRNLDRLKHRVAQPLQEISICHIIPACACLELLLCDQTEGIEQRPQAACGRQQRIDAGEVLAVLYPELHVCGARRNAARDLFNITVERLEAVAVALALKGVRSEQVRVHAPHHGADELLGVGVHVSCCCS